VTLDNNQCLFKQAMPDGGISLLPEEMRKQEEEELKEKAPVPPDRPELYVPGKQSGPAEPKSFGIGQRPPTPPAEPPRAPAPPAPAPEKKPESEEIVPFKQRPKQPRPEPPKRQAAAAPKRSLRVSLIPEEVPEKKINIRGRQITLVVIVVLEVIVLGAAAFLFQNGINSKNKEIGKIDTDIMAIKTQLSDLQDQQKELYLFEDKLNVMNQLLAGHVYTSHVFTFLEEHTLPDIWYKSYISTKQGSVSLSVATSDLKTAARQIAHLEMQPEVLSINVNNFQTEIDDLGQILGATFEMQIIFNEDFLLAAEE